MIVAPGVLRTPDECFRDLPGFDFAPHYHRLNDARFGELRMHYVDEGPRDAPVVLMLHGEPSWSFLYRKMIGPVAAAGYRAIAPDHIGFGRSDKLARRSDYSYQNFVDWLSDWVLALDLRHITLVCQDWGGPIGLRLLSAMPERFDGVLATNTLLPTCEAPPLGIAEWPGEIVANWVASSAQAQDLPIAEIIAGTCVARPEPAVLRAYDAPFPDASYKAAALEFPSLIPIREELPGVLENRAAWRVLENFSKPFLTAFSDSDPSTKAWERVFRERVPGARKQPHTQIGAAGHFVQEEKGEVLAQVLLDWLAQNRAS